MTGIHGLRTAGHADSNEADGRPARVAGNQRDAIARDRCRQSLMFVDSTRARQDLLRRKVPVRRSIRESRLGPGS